jgi:hypothetical protein
MTPPAPPASRDARRAPRAARARSPLAGALALAAASHAAALLALAAAGRAPDATAFGPADDVTVELADGSFGAPPVGAAAANGEAAEGAGGVAQEGAAETGAEERGARVGSSAAAAVAVPRSGPAAGARAAGVGYHRSTAPDRPSARPSFGPDGDPAPSPSESLREGAPLPAAPDGAPGGGRGEREDAPSGERVGADGAPSGAGFAGGGAPNGAGFAGGGAPNGAGARTYDGPVPRAGRRGAEATGQARPGPLAPPSIAERNLRQAFADESTPFGVRDPLLGAARAALNAPDAPRAGRAWLSVAIRADGTVGDVVALASSTESEAWARVRDRLAAALRGRRLASGGRAARVTLEVGATLMPTDGGGATPPSPRWPSPAELAAADAPAYRGESGSVTPYAGPVVTPRQVADLVGAVAAAVKGEPRPVAREPFARVVRFARE